MAVFHGNQLYLANVGDGEAVLCRNGEALRISTLHRYTNSEERLRVENAGGIFVNGSLAHPVWNAQLINIQLTRSFGDAYCGAMLGDTIARSRPLFCRYFKLSKYVKDANSGLIAEPSIQRVVLKSYDEFVLMATDGYACAPPFFCVSYAFKFPLQLLGCGKARHRGSVCAQHAAAPKGPRGNLRRIDTGWSFFLILHFAF